MKIAGIIAEYNPFHRGHAHHIRETRRLSGCDFVVYCPFLEKPMHIVRIERNDEDILKIHERISLAEKYISENIIKNKNSDKDDGNNRSCEVGDADTKRDKPKRKGVAEA